MEQKKILLILLPLLFLGLFLDIDKIYAEGSIRLRNISVSIIDATDNSNNIISERSSFDNPIVYPYAFGPEWSWWGGVSWPNVGYNIEHAGYVRNLALHTWFQMYAYCEDARTYSYTAGGSSNEGYHEPGYYMMKVNYAPVTDYGYRTGYYSGYNFNGWYFFDGWSYPSSYSYLFSYAPGLTYWNDWESIKTVYVPVLITQSYQDINLNLKFTGDRQGYYWDYDTYEFFDVAYSPIKHNGECGSLNGTYTESSLPSSGTACLTWPYVAGVNWPTINNPTTTWTCEGSNGGADQGCAMKLKVDGVCNSSTNGHQLSIQPSGDELCSKGAPTVIIGDGSSQRPWQWGCLGINGGVSTSNTACSATIKKDGKCGTFTNGGSFLSAPSGNNNLCDYGTATAVSGSGPWTWKCNSPDGGAQSGTCTAYLSVAVDGVCGPAATTYNFGDTAFSGNLCTVGTATPTPFFPTESNPIKTWTCVSTAGSSPTCTAVLKVDGECGTAAVNYQIDDLFPGTYSYCDSGTMLVNSQTYYYRVSAINSGGTSVPSNTATISTP